MAICVTFNSYAITTLHYESLIKRKEVVTPHEISVNLMYGTKNYQSPIRLPTTRRFAPAVR